MRYEKEKSFLSQQGSVLMEFILVLPIYMVVIGGILWMGFRSLDATGLRTADRWGAWMAGNRFSTRVPAMAALQSVFPRTYMIQTSVNRALVGPHSFVQFIGSKASIAITKPDYIGNWLDMPKNIYGDDSFFSFNLPVSFMNSSRYKNKYTHFVVMRTKSSRTSKRHWHPSLLYKDDIWDIEDTNKDDLLPKEWKLELITKAKHKKDDKNEKKEPEKEKFYERFSVYEKWSKGS